VATRSAKCKACGVRTTASAGYCQRCKSLRHHGYKRVKDENLVVDQVGGAWWIWDARGNVLVAGKPTRTEAIIALAVGEDDVDDDVAAEESSSHATKTSAAQLQAEIDEALATTHATLPMRRPSGRILRVFRRVEPGRYHVEAGNHTWHVFRVRSDYGDMQWIVDRDDSPGFAQCDTLDCVRATIINAVRDEQSRTSHG
jgi:hypothetical protein